MSIKIRLLRVAQVSEDDKYRFESFDNDRAPPYAVLSHMWSSNGEDEVTYNDICRSKGWDKSGFTKLQFCNERAADDGLNYFWIDTCCIDKTDEVELQGSISQMFRWYEGATKCYVYMLDVSTPRQRDNVEHGDFSSNFESSRWFKRGWTLQELLAPAIVEFYSYEKKILGNKDTLKSNIHNTTGISVRALEGQDVNTFSVEERLSWAGGRQTSIPEDASYSLLGIFGVSMELRYGEGQEEARRRLLEELQYQEGGVVVLQPQIREPIIDWLSPLNFSAQQSDVISRRQEGTLSWFIESAQFTGWVRGQYTRLLCYGAPGVGKTMVAAVAIDHLKSIRQADVGLAWAFCNYRAQINQSAPALLAALLKQLLYARPDLLAIAAELRGRYGGHDSRPSAEDLFVALSNTCSSLTCTYLVIDALDECSDQYGARTQLIDRLKELQATSNVRLLYTTRDMSEVGARVEADITLHVRSSEADIKRYTEGQKERMPAFIKRDFELWQKVHSKILEATDGMFLLACLHLDTIASKTSRDEVELLLTKLRSGSDAISDAYDDARRRIDGQLTVHRHLGRQALSWVTYSRRPLKTVELRHALAIRNNTSHIDSDRVPEVKDISAACAGLMVVDEESQTVRLVHYTTQEYLERVREEWLPRAPQQVAEACLTYLSYDAFRGGSSDTDAEYEQRVAQ